MAIRSPDAAGVSPNAGQSFNVGPLAFKASIASLDIVTCNGVSSGLAILQLVGGTGRAGLYDVNPLNGRTARMGTLPRELYSDIAIVPDGVTLTL